MQHIMLGKVTLCVLDFFFLIKQLKVIVIIDYFWNTHSDSSCFVHRRAIW